MKRLEGTEKGTAVVGDAPGQWSGLPRSGQGPLGAPWPPVPRTFGAVPGGRAVTLGFALLRGWGPQSLCALARRLASVAGAAHRTLLLADPALCRALRGVAAEPRLGCPCPHPRPPGAGLPRPTRRSPSEPGDSGASCNAWWLAAWLRAGSARGAAWRGGRSSCTGRHGGGGLARSWGCTAVGEGVSCSWALQSRMHGAGGRVVVQREVRRGQLTLDRSLGAGGATN